MTTFERLKETIANVACVDEDKITPEAHFENDLGLDSLDSVECIMEVEEVLGVMLDDEVLEKIITVADAVKALDEALSENGRAA